MVADPSGEIPTDEDFCERMVEARRRKGMSQKALGKRIGVSQNTISMIESGKSSAFIDAVCRVLKIPGPMFGFTPEQRRWAVLGHRLQEMSPASFKLTAQGVEQVVAELAKNEKKPPPIEDEDKPPKKARAVGTIHIGVSDGARARLRAADELPHEKSKR